MASQDQPTRSPNVEKPEGERKSEWGEGTSEGAGASNRPQADEVTTQESDLNSGSGMPVGKVE